MWLPRRDPTPPLEAPETSQLVTKATETEKEKKSDLRPLQLFGQDRLGWGPGTKGPGGPHPRHSPYWSGDWKG